MMNTTVELMGVALAALLAENFVLVTCMGIGTRTRSFQDPIDALRTGYCLTIVMVLSALAAWCINTWIFAHRDWHHFRLFVFALMVPSLIYGLRKFLQLFIPELSRRTDEHLQSISTNCAALGCCLLISSRSYDLLTTLTFSLFGGIGATIALTSFTYLMGEANLRHCPECFRGVPMQLITAGLMAMSLVGFYGLHFS